MHIIQISAAYKPAYVYGGPTMSVSKLCEVICDNNQSGSTKTTLEVLTTTANGFEELQVDIAKTIMVDGVPVTYFKRLTKDHTHFSPSLLWALFQKIKQAKKQRQDLIIHIHAWWNLVSIFSALISISNGIPVVLSPRGMLTQYTIGSGNSLSKAILHTLIGKRLLSHCRIHATSEKEKKDVLDNFSVKSIDVIPNFVQLEKETKAASRDHHFFKLVFLSRVEQKKGLELLFDALPYISFPWQLEIAGTGLDSYIRILKQKAVDLKIEHRIHWLGHVKNEEKFHLLAHQDLLLLTSYNENFANVVIESLSVGTPVLISKEVGLSDYVERKELGWVCSLDPRSIAEKIEEIFESVADRDRIRKDAPIVIRNDFEDQILFGQYIKMYQGVL